MASECKECKGQTVVSAGLEAYNVKYHFTDDTRLSSEDCTLELWLHKLVRYSLIFFGDSFFVSMICFGLRSNHSHSQLGKADDRTHSPNL